MPETSHTLHFRKSSYSGGQTQDCIEVADVPGLSAVRDTKRREDGYLAFPSSEWSALLRSAI
ncbi:DUF397 domain-containing protein [Nocardiopsis sp. JB363]|uniref:DUF397 domain-containing protein n=1 Tax=Nocardiopsis sp. JB363 TaxID=1434837 RepID=UPI000B358155|nr:DUF397 domain-containing protein [Nocardiopsis sp. JB363]